MIIICSNCNTKYSISKRVLGKNGKKVKCSNCEHEWYQKIDIIKTNIANNNIKTLFVEKAHHNMFDKSPDQKFIFNEVLQFLNSH